MIAHVFKNSLTALLFLSYLAGADSGIGFKPSPVGPENAPWKTTPKAASELPAELQDVNIVEHLGESVDLSLAFKNESGETVALSNYVNGQKPVLLSLVYFGCPGLCNFHLNGVTDTLKQMDWRLGNQFDMVVVSFDESEGPDLAQSKKESHLKELGQPDAAKGWHFLTGSKENVQKLAQQVGFKFRWDSITNQWAHTSAMYVLSPTGKITRYLYGIQFEPKLVKLSLVEGSEGKVGSVMDHLILTCFQYDPNRKTYAFFAYNLLRYGSAVVVLLTAAFLIPVWLRERKKTKIEGVV